MASTSFARSIASTQIFQRNRPERPAVGTDWQVMAIYRALPPTGQPWFMAAGAIADVDPGVVGELRLRSSSQQVTSVATEVTGFNPAVVVGYQQIDNTDQLIYVEGRRVSGFGGIRLIDVGVSLMSAPPFSSGSPPPDGGGGDPGSCTHTLVTQTPVPTITPGPGGITRDINSLADWNNVRSIANPGDVIVFKQDLTGSFDWRGDKVSAGGQNAQSGVPGNHITITADPGVTITGVAGTSGSDGVIDIRGVDHIDVIGVTTRGGQFGIRYQAVAGTALSPCKISHNDVGFTGDAHITVQAWFELPWTVSEYVDVEDNEIHGTAVDTTSAAFCEGVYFGRGTPRWVDRSHHLNARRNWIHDLESDGVDIKPGVTDWEVVHNYIENIIITIGGGPLGAISALYADVAGGNTPATGDIVPPADILNGRGLIQANRIRNCPNFNPIVIGYGGVNCYDNLIWDYGDDRAAVRFQSEQSFAPAGQTPVQNNITCNTFQEGGWESVGPTPAPTPIIFTDDNLYDGSFDGEYTHAPADFAGTTTGTALAEGYTAGFDGDGTGFMLDPASNANNVATLCQGLMDECPGTPGHFGAMPQTNGAPAPPTDDIELVATDELLFTETLQASHDIPLPAEILAGHHLEVLVNTQEIVDVGPPTTPVGWNQEFSLGGSPALRPRITKLWRLADGSEANISLTVTFPVATRCNGVSQVWRNVDAVTPYDVPNSSASVVTAANPDPPSIEPVTSGAVVQTNVAGNIDGGGTATPSVDYATTINQNAAGRTDDRAFVNAHRQIITPAPEDPGLYSWLADNSTAVTDALRPANPSTPPPPPTTFATFHEATPSATNAPGTNHVVSYPATVNDGDLLIFVGQWNANNTISLAAGWTRLANNNAGGPGTIEVWARIAPVANGLGGTTFNFASSASQAAAFTIRRYSDTSGGLVAGTDYDIAAVGAWANSTNPDPANVIATWGSTDNTFIALGGGRGDNDIASAAPTNYGNLATSASTNGGGGGAEVYSADRNLAAAADNPDAFTLPGTERVFAYTLVIRPA